MEVSYSFDGYYLTQVKNIFLNFIIINTFDNKVVDTSIAPLQIYLIIDGLIYLTVTHSDILYAVHLIS